jgi:uncharacterized protein YaiE (UPF0345 family)
MKTYIYKSAQVGFSTTPLDLMEVDDTVHNVEIPTPENWHCERSNCKFDVKHTHTTYAN